MNQFNEYVGPINPTKRTFKNFIYKGKKYPIDFSLVKKYSNYFYNNKDKFKSTEDIEIKPDNYDIVDEAIPTFISCCQNMPFNITDTNVFSLHQLSIQYEVPALNEITSQCINKNKKPLVFQSILYKLQNQNSKVNFDLSPEEELIATNFFEYINDEQIFQLPISVLYHIVNNEHLKLNSMNLTNQGQFIQFLFKCLEKYKREASILFLNLDLEGERIDILSQLIARYSDVFDFNMMNPFFLAKNASFVLSEMKKLKIEFANKLSQIEEENKKQKEFFLSSQKSFDDSKNQLINSNDSLIEKIQKLESELLNQKKSSDEKIHKLESEQNEHKNKLNEMEQKLNEQQKQLERYTCIKVANIEIKSEPETLEIGKTIELSTFVKPELAFNVGVEWQIEQEFEGSVQVESMNEKKLVLKCLKDAKKVTVVAKALDGSGVMANRVIQFGNLLKGTIEVSVQKDQTIKGTIRVIEEGGATMDKHKSKFILNSSSSSNLGVNGYESGSILDSLVKEVSFSTQKGEFYLHVLVFDNFGNSKELISQRLVTNGSFEECFYDGSNALKGILAHLTKISGGNIQTNKTIEIKCSNFCCGSIESLADLNCVNNVHVGYPIPCWIQYDFKNRNIQIDSYTVKSANRNGSISSWAIEISDDEVNWTKIDEKNNINDSGEENKIYFFKVQMSKPFRYLRIITNKKDFTIGKLEFFGKIISH